MQPRLESRERVASEPVIDRVVVAGAGRGVAAVCAEVSGAAGSGSGAADSCPVQEPPHDISVLLLRLHESHVTALFEDGKL